MVLVAGKAAADGTSFSHSFIAIEKYSVITFSVSAFFEEAFLTTMPF